MKKYFNHTTAEIEKGAIIGEGTKIWNNCHVMPGACIGENCVLGQNVSVASKGIIGNNVKIQNNVSIFNEVIIEDECFLGPSMVFTNVNNPRAFIERKDEYKKTYVKKGATIGANATILCGVTVGGYSFVGAGSVVTKDVGAYWLVYGNPARRRAFVCKCALKLEFKNDTVICSCGLRYKKISSDEIVPIMQ